MKKVLVFLALVLAVTAGLPAGEAKAVDTVDSEACSHSFLGFRTWFAGLTMTAGDCAIVAPGECAKYDKNTGELTTGSGATCEQEINGITSTVMPIATFIWIIALNVLYDLFLAIGYLAIGFIIYGGYQFVMGQGDPSKIARGKKTVTNAIVGLAIAVFATVISNTIVNIVSSNSKPYSDVDSFQASWLSNVFTYAFFALGVLATGMIVYGGFQYVSSAGDPSKAKKAQQTIIYSVVGLVVAILAGVITNIVIGAGS
jgi:hypothetical protein